jgi:predicted enzyme related to lactoylglutathione lyase
MKIFNVTFDAADPVALAAFWSAVVERPVTDGASEHFAMIDGDGAPNLLFLRVPEGKTAKNRVHLDLECDDLAAARTQLESLGATFVHEKHEYDIHWYTFQDPEGNELCVAALGAHG